MHATDLIADLKAAARPDPQDQQFLARFFKTAEGQYGAGDRFIGVRVPTIRQICKKYRTLGLDQIEQALESPIHEVRLAAAIIMADQAKKADVTLKRGLYDLYIRRTDRINNWDIVDSSCYQVVGGYLLTNPRAKLYELAKSDNLWERRIAIVSTWIFIREGQLDDTFAISQLLLGDTHDLIHKATGWMLREAGKRDPARLKEFLQKYAPRMPRTTLRYAIERFDPDERQYFMQLR